LGALKVFEFFGEGPNQSSPLQKRKRRRRRKRKKKEEVIF